MRNDVEVPLQKKWKSKKRLSTALFVLAALGLALNLISDPIMSSVFGWLLTIVGLGGQSLIFSCPSCGKGVGHALTADYCHRCGFHLKIRE